MSSEDSNPEYRPTYDVAKGQFVAQNYEDAFKLLLGLKKKATEKGNTHWIRKLNDVIRANTSQLEETGVIVKITSGGVIVESKDDAVMERIFYDPGAALYEDGNYTAAAALWLQGYNLANEKKLATQAGRFKKLYNMAMADAKKFGNATTGASGGSGPAAPKKDDDAPADPVREILIKDGRYMRTFKDIAGLEAEKAEIQRSFILPLLYPKTLKSGRAFLLYGPPGTGKSYVVKAIASEMMDTMGGPAAVDVQLYLASGADIKGKYVGDTEKNLKHYFSFAEKQAVTFEKANPNKKALAVIFMDEFDAIGGTRASGDANMTSSVNALLQLLEGAGEGYPHVVFSAATNFPWRLDPAVVRRFTTKLFMDIPGNGARYTLVLNKIVNRVKCELSKVEPLAKMITELTSWSTAGVKAFQDKLAERKVPKEGSQAFIEGYDHAASQNALFPLGVSSSDLDKMIDIGLNRVGIMKLQKQFPKRQCFPIIPEMCTGQSCVPCTNLSEEDRDDLKLTEADITSTSATNEFREAIRSFATTVNAGDYAALVVYKLTGRDPNE